MNFKCDRCGKTFPVVSSFGGQAVHCPKCKEGKLVPSFHPAAPAEGAAGSGESAAPAAAHPHPAQPASVIKGNLLKKRIAAAQAASKGRLSEGTRTFLTIAGLMGGIVILVGLIVIYPILRDSGTGDEKKPAPAPAAAKAAGAPAGKEASPGTPEEKTPPAGGEAKKEGDAIIADGKDPAAPAEEAAAKEGEKAETPAVEPPPAGEAGKAAEEKEG